MARFEAISSEILLDSIQQAILKLALPRTMQEVVFTCEFFACKDLRAAVVQIHIGRAAQTALTLPTDIQPAAVNALTKGKDKSKGKIKGKFGKGKGGAKPSASSASSASSAATPAAFFSTGGGNMLLPKQ